MNHLFRTCAVATLFALLAGCANEKKPTAATSAAADDCECCKVPATKVSATQPATAPTASADADWKVIFDGKSLDGWTPTAFGGNAAPTLEEGEMIIPQADTLSGVNFTGETPKVNYEIEVVARRRTGSDFFCGLTFPVNDSHASLILGGWGGSLCGISSIDGNDASENSTTSFNKFEKNKWYTIRMRVLPTHLQAWIDEKQIVDLDTKDKKINIRIEVGKSRPFGLSTYQTEGGIKSVKIREVKEAA